MLGVCMKYLKDEDNAKDAVQEILVRVLTEVNKHKVSYFKSWIYRVTVNHCLVKIRNHKQNVPIIETEVEHTLPDNHSETQQKIEKETLLNKLDESMTELNEEQRKCIELFYLQNKSYREIEAITGFNSLQVKSFIQNGKRNLKLLLEKKQDK